MENLQNTLPPSLRVPLADPRFTPERSTRTSFAYPVSSAGSAVSVWTKSRFARLPHEPEDAKLTGVTRSLNRRLLGLNVSGSLVSQTLVSARVA